jgi:hypothetical protein
MKTLRVVRNVAALFIFAIALLSLRPGVGVAHAASGKSCGYRKGSYSCSIDASGHCTESLCHKGTKSGGDLCPNFGCV